MSGNRRIDPSVFVTRAIPEAGLDVLRRANVRFEIGQHVEEEGVDDAVLRAGFADHDVVISLLTERIDRGLLTASGRMRGVANMAVGFDNIDVAAATELGIPVSNTPGVLTGATADLTFALLLAVARRIPEADAYTRAGRFAIWGPRLLLGAGVGPGPDGRRKVLGVVGYGRIGRAVARRAAGFDLDVLAYGRSREAIESSGEDHVRFAPLEELLGRSDFVSLHVPLGASTHHLIGESQLRAMRSTAILVNTSRGPVVDERALVTALREGWIGGAGLDVYEQEPALAPGLVECPNTILLPHVASATDETRGRMAVMAAENALCHLRGAPAPDVIQPAVYLRAAFNERRAAAAHDAG